MYQWRVSQPVAFYSSFSVSSLPIAMMLRCLLFDRRRFASPMSQSQFVLLRVLTAYATIFSPGTTSRVSHSDSEFQKADPPEWVSVSWSCQTEAVEEPPKKQRQLRMCWVTAINFAVLPTGTIYSLLSVISSYTSSWIMERYEMFEIFSHRVNWRNSLKIEKEFTKVFENIKWCWLRECETRNLERKYAIFVSHVYVHDEFFLLNKI